MSGLSNMFQVNYFRLSHLYFMWNAVSFMKFLTPSGFFQQKRSVFCQSCLKSFPLWAECSGICLSVLTSTVDTCRALLGKYTDWTHMEPTSVSARTMGDAHSSVSQLGCSDVSSKWQPLSSSLPFFSIIFSLKN